MNKDNLILAESITENVQSLAARLAKASAKLDAIEMAIRLRSQQAVDPLYNAFDFGVMQVVGDIKAILEAE